MYKQKNKTKVERSTPILYRIKRKLLLIITAFMMGISNSMNDEEDAVNGSCYTIEQEDKWE